MTRVLEIAAIVILCFSFALLSAARSAQAFAEDSAAASHNLLSRRYQNGQRTTYAMSGDNDGWHYQIQADGVVGRDSSGKYSEEYIWSHLLSDGAPVALSAPSATFRQVLSLAPGHSVLAVPDLRHVMPMLIGPITDLLTFYSDSWLAAQQVSVKHAGDHAYVKYGVPASWADGTFVLLGEDSIDFDVTLSDIDPQRKIATVLVKHVPPDKPQVKLPAQWMNQPVHDTANNWVQVKKVGDKFAASVGKETFEDELKVDLLDGKILSAILDNPVEILEKECSDAALTQCGPGKQYSIRRRIQLSLKH